MRLDDLNISWGQGIFRRTKRISFELSNICNLAAQHRRCPVNLVRETRVLPERIVNGVLETCRAHQFRGVIAFHMYNEPGIDPRLVYFMRHIKSLLPDVKLFLLTNGWYLTQSLAEEFVGHGLDFMDISAYSQQEWERLQKINVPIRVRVIRQVLDDRMQWNNRKSESAVRSDACYCPVYEICISCSGQVCLCPYDWERRHVFGDLNQESLEQILRRPEIWEVYENLSIGKRTLDVCRNCRTSRGEAFVDARPQ